MKTSVTGSTLHDAVRDSEVRDNGRRGAPRPGCDCLQCFGYCMINKDAEHRELSIRRENPAQTDRAAVDTVLNRSE